MFTWSVNNCTWFFLTETDVFGIIETIFPLTLIFKLSFSLFLYLCLWLILYLLVLNFKIIQTHFFLEESIFSHSSSSISTTLNNFSICSLRICVPTSPSTIVKEKYCGSECFSELIAFFLK